MRNWLKKLMPLILVNLLTKEYNTKIKYTESKISRITNSATTGVEDKIPNVSNLVTKADYVKK